MAKGMLAEIRAVLEEDVLDDAVAHRLILAAFVDFIETNREDRKLHDEMHDTDKAAQKIVNEKVTKMYPFHRLNLTVLTVIGTGVVGFVLDRVFG